MTIDKLWEKAEKAVDTHNRIAFKVHRLSRTNYHITCTYYNGKRAENAEGPTIFGALTSFLAEFKDAGNHQHV